MKTAKELPQFIQDLLASPPRAGEGVNLYLYRLARVLHPYRRADEIFETLHAVTANCGRLSPRRKFSVPWRIQDQRHGSQAKAIPRGSNRHGL